MPRGDAEVGIGRGRHVTKGKARHHEPVDPRIGAALRTILGYGAAAAGYFVAPAYTCFACLGVSFVYLCKWLLDGAHFRCHYLALANLMAALTIVAVAGPFLTWFWWWTLPVIALPLARSCDELA